MKSNLEKLSGLERRLNIEVPLPLVQAAFAKAYADIQKNAAIKGFRKGKAPMPTIRSIYGDKVKRDVVENLVQEHYWAALREHELNPAGSPKIGFDPITEESEFRFTVDLEVFPEVKVDNFEGLSIVREKLPDISAQVQSSLNKIRENRASQAPLLEDRPARMGDVAVIDFQGFLNGEAFEGGQASDFDLELGSKQFVDGFEAGIEGMKTGETRTIAVKFPDDYQAPNLAGQNTEFKVTLKQIKRKVIPELNDEFAKSLGGSYQTLAELEKSLGENILQEEEQRIRSDLKQRVLQALVEKNPVEVPKSLHEEQKQALIEDVKQRIQKDGGSDAEIEEYKARWDGEFDKSADFMIRSSLLLDTLAEKLQLTASEEDIQARLDKYAAQTGIERSKLDEYYGKKRARSRLAFQITEEKVIDFILSKANVQEMTREQITSQESSDN